MDNQHRKIKGYRELSQTEIDLMNEVKAKGVELGELVEKIQAHLIEQKRLLEVAQLKPGGDDDAYLEVQRIREAEPQRWASIGKTDLQIGLMALTRSIAQPGFF